MGPQKKKIHRIWNLLLLLLCIPSPDNTYRNYYSIYKEEEKAQF